MSGPQVILGPAPLPRSPAAAHLRASFAQRHVPLPAPLADSLAEFLAARQPMLHPVWGRAFACMARALDVSGAVASQSLVRGALDRFLVVVAEPLLRAAAHRAGVLPLAGAGPSADPGWSEAEAAVRRHAEAALADPQPMGRAFWVHAALDLHQAALHAARGRARQGAVPAPAPEIDPALAALVFLHPPRFDEALLRERRRRHPRLVSAHRRAGIRPKEGGVAGIRQSHGFEDLPDSLFSELIQPRALLANKLLHEGLLVRHRPPRRTPRRDLLAVTLMQAGAGDGMGLIVKAAWADAAIRLRVALHRMGLGNSDLVWSAAAGPPAHLGCAIDGPGFDRLPPLAIAGRVRADMLLRSGLMPGFAVLPAGAAGEPGLAACLRRGLQPLAAGRRRDVTLLPADYGRRFVLACRPWRGGQDPDWTVLRPEIAAELGRGPGALHLACLAWRPAGAGAPPDLLALADGREPLVLAPPAPPLPESDGGLADFMGSLVHWMMTVTLEALDAAQA